MDNKVTDTPLKVVFWCIFLFSSDTLHGWKCINFSCYCKCMLKLAVSNIISLGIDYFKHLFYRFILFQTSSYFGIVSDVSFIWIWLFRISFYLDFTVRNGCFIWIWLFQVSALFGDISNSFKHLFYWNMTVSFIYLILISLFQASVLCGFDWFRHLVYLDVIVSYVCFILVQLFQTSVLIWI